MDRHTRLWHGPNLCGIYMCRQKRDVKWIIQQHEMCGLDCVSWAYGPVAGCCEYGRRDRG